MEKTMDVDKLEWEEEIKRDRELEMQQDAYEERMFMAKIALLHEEPESIQNWTEWQVFSEACEQFKEFCEAYDLDFKLEVTDTIQGV